VAATREYGITMPLNKNDNLKNHSYIYTGFKILNYDYVKKNITSFWALKSP